MDNLKIYNLVRVVPEEAKKLESALLRQEGSCVVFCVAEDAPGAEKIVDSYFD